MSIGARNAAMDFARNAGTAESLVHALDEAGLLPKTEAVSIPIDVTAILDLQGAIEALGKLKNPILKRDLEGIKTQLQGVLAKLS